MSKSSFLVLCGINESLASLDFLSEHFVSESCVREKIDRSLENRLEFFFQPHKLLEGPFVACPFEIDYEIDVAEFVIRAISVGSEDMQVSDVVTLTCF